MPTLSLEDPGLLCSRIKGEYWQPGRAGPAGPCVLVPFARVLSCELPQASSLVLGAAYVQDYSAPVGLLELVRLAKDEAGLLPALHPTRYPPHH